MGDFYIDRVNSLEAQIKKALAAGNNAQAAAFCREAARAVEAIAAAARENEVGLLVLGLPKNMDGTEGPRAEKSRAVAALLEEATGLEVRLWDERRSSIEAHAILHANGKKEKKHRQTVDAVAASLILEGFLGAHGAEYRK